MTFKWKRIKSECKSLCTYKCRTVKERGGGQTFSTSFWMRFSQAPLCRCRFKDIFADIIFLLSGNIQNIFAFDVSIQ